MHPNMNQVRELKPSYKLAVGSGLKKLFLTSRFRLFTKCGSQGPPVHVDVLRLQRREQLRFCSPRDGQAEDGNTITFLKIADSTPAMMTTFILRRRKTGWSIH